MGIYIDSILQQEVFTWGSPDYIGHSGGKNQPGQVQGISSGDTIIKVSFNPWVINVASHWQNV